MTISQRLRAVRTLRNLKQEELARMTGIPGTIISMMENGKVLPGDDWEAKLRAALNWTPELDAQLDTINSEAAV